MFNWRDTWNSIYEAASDCIKIIKGDFPKDISEENLEKTLNAVGNTLPKTVETIVAPKVKPVVNLVNDVVNLVKDEPKEENIEEPILPPVVEVPQKTTNLVSKKAKTISEPTTTDNAKETIEDKYNKNWERAKQQSQLALASSIASGVASIYESKRNYKENVKNLEFEQQMAEKQIDTNLANYEAALSDQLANSMANLDYAASVKNVDLSSQAITGAKDYGLEQMGKDIQNETTKSKLQKAAINLQTAYQKSQLKKAKQSATTNAIMDISSKLINLKSYDSEDYKLY